MQSAQIPDSEIWTTERLPRLTQNRQCTHLSFVQAQHYRVALESRAIRKLNHKSEMVRNRLRRLEAFNFGNVDAKLSNVSVLWLVSWQGFNEKRNAAYSLRRREPF